MDVVASWYYAAAQSQPALDSSDLQMRPLQSQCGAYYVMRTQRLISQYYTFRDLRSQESMCRTFHLERQARWLARCLSALGARECELNCRGTRVRAMLCHRDTTQILR